MYDVQMYDVRGGQSSIQGKAHPQGAFFLPSYINFTSYIVPSYIFLAFFLVYGTQNVLFAKKNYTIRKFFRTSVAYMKNILYLCALFVGEYYLLNF